METGRKHFRKRDAILACVRDTDVHPSADWVYHQLKPQIPDLSLGTVYRNLAYFKEQGDIISLGTVHGVERFDGNTKPHVHFICTSCAAVVDLPQVAVPQELTEAAAMNTGDQVTGCSLTFTGICGQCATRNHLNQN
jgi:Fur family peroxide stress response transcriptional regulator